MGDLSTSAAVFAARLRAEMNARGLSRRALGKLIDPDNSERGRRKVLRHLSGKHAPSGASRRTYAVALGLPEGTFLDDEEEEPLSLADQLLAVTRMQQEASRALARLSRLVAA